MACKENKANWHCYRGWGGLCCVPLQVQIEETSGCISMLVCLKFWAFSSRIVLHQSNHFWKTACQDILCTTLCSTFTYVGGTGGACIYLVWKLDLAWAADDVDVVRSLNDAERLQGSRSGARSLLQSTPRRTLLPGRQSHTAAPAFSPESGNYTIDTSDIRNRVEQCWSSMRTPDFWHMYARYKFGQIDGKV